MLGQNQSYDHRSNRELLDKLFAADAVISMMFGIITLITPHVFIAELAGGSYNHSVHEALRMYACMRLACGWILWHARKIDDGLFRRHICEALLVCYILQALVVLRAQFTDRHVTINWVAICVLMVLSFSYGSFRFGKGGNMIKMYDLPTAAIHQ